MGTVHPELLYHQKFVETFSPGSHYAMQGTTCEYEQESQGIPVQTTCETSVVRFEPLLRTAQIASNLPQNRAGPIFLPTPESYCMGVNKTDFGVT